MTRLLRGVFIILVSGLLFGLTPDSAAAQLQSCGFCVPDGAGVDCSTSGEQSQLLCEGVFLGFLCLGCEENPTSVPDLITPDGSFGGGLGRNYDGTTLRAFGEELSRGVFVARLECNLALTSTWYDTEAEGALRAATSRLTL